MRDPIQFRHRYEEIDLATYKQLLGDISKEEVYELNKVFTPYDTGFCFQKSVKEPAGLFCWRAFSLAALWGVGAGIAVYARFVKKYNMLWFVGGFVPMWAMLYYNWVRQPNQHMENGYKYLLAKRAATCEYEKNKKQFEKNAFTKTTEFAQLQ